MGPEWQGGQGEAAQQDPEGAWSPLASLPRLSCRGAEELGGDSALPSVTGRPSCRVQALHLGSSRAVPWAQAGS